MEEYYNDDYLDEMISHEKQIQADRENALRLLATLDDERFQAFMDGIDITKEITNDSAQGVKESSTDGDGLTLGMFDTRSFKQQHSRFDETFIADEDVSFTANDGRRHEFFLELDNRTETNGANVDKIINYINYARNNSDSEILMQIAYADGSVPTKRIPNFSFIHRKVSNLVDRFMRTSISSPNTTEKYYLASLLWKTQNLSVAVSQLSEAHFDPAAFYLGSDFKDDVLESVSKYVNFINQSREYDWECSFSPMPDFYGQRKASRQIGTITYSHKLEFRKYEQPVLLGIEHDLDTIIEFHVKAMQSRNSKDLSAPCVVYPTRSRPLYAISLKDDAHLFTWPTVWNPKLPIFIQPTYSLSDSKQLKYDLQDVMLRYSSSIHRYFKTGGLNASDLKKHKSYEQTFLPTSGENRRSYSELHELAKETNDSAEFIQQLSIEEVPISVFKELLSRRPNGIFNPTLIEERPFLEHDLYQTPAFPNVASWVSYPNSVNPESRIKPFF